jgi:16S rRNA U516 pseudouridylate synthase RsuA-like enzyme
VRQLIRVRIGPVQLGDLKPGQWRQLSPTEIAALADYTGAAWD